MPGFSGVFGVKGERGIKGDKGHAGLLVSNSRLTLRFNLNYTHLNTNSYVYAKMCDALFYRVRLGSWGKGDHQAWQD